MEWYEKIRARREELGLSQAALAKRVGLSQPAIDKIERGGVLRTRAAPALARELNLPLVEIDADLASASYDLSAEPNAGAPKPVQMPVHDRIPVYGQAVGGDDGRFVMNGQRLMDIFCPPPLVGVKGAYAVIFYGTSMEPRYFAGEAGWVNPHLPVRKGDFVVAQIRSDDPGDPPYGYVKQLISRSERELVLKQLNPPEGEGELMRFPGGKVISVHKIVIAGQF